MHIIHGRLKRSATLSEHKEAISRLFPFWPDQLADDSVAGYELRVKQMQGIIDRMRKRGPKHWAFSTAVYEDMLAVLNAEKVLMRRAKIRVVT